MDSLTVKIIRSHRKTLSLSVTGLSEVTVKSPLWVRKGDIERLIEQKQTWIQKRLTVFTQTRLHAPGLKAGAYALILGNRYQVSLAPEYSSTVRLTDTSIVVSKYIDVRSALVSWYKAEAGKYIQSRIKDWEALLGIKAKTIRITSATTRWGSASARFGVNVAWRSFQAPAWVVDYILVHELIHLVHPNHSQRFWRAVQNAYPEYKKARNWLKSNNFLLKT